MKLPKELVTITPLSIIVSGISFIFFVVLAFYLGMQYQQVQDLSEEQRINIQSTAVTQQKSPTSNKNADQTADWKTYENTTDNYSFQYPAEWVIKTENHAGYKTSWIVLTPPIPPCPTNFDRMGCALTDRINISVDDNAENFSIEDFAKRVNNNYSMKFTSSLIGGEKALRTNDRLGQYAHEDVYVAKDKKVYTLSVLDADLGEETRKISQEEFDKLLTTFKFTDSLVKDSPSANSQTFYDWYANCLNSSPAGICNYKESKLVSSELVNRIAAYDENFNKQCGDSPGCNHGDLILCAQNVPQSISVDNEKISGSTATVTVHTTYGASGDNPLTVSLKNESGTWKLTNISCSKYSL